MKVLNLYLQSVRNIFIVSTLLLYSASSYAQDLIEDQIVETYYISNQDDFNGVNSDDIAPGTKIYRVFLDLCQGCKIKELFGTPQNPLTIKSDSIFFNSSFGAIRGYNLNPAFLAAFDTAPLDSYLSMGAASTTDWGIPKELDSDGSIWEGRTPPQPLTNTSEEIGIPLTESDGLLSTGGSSLEPSDWQFSSSFESELGSVFGANSNDSVFGGGSTDQPFTLKFPTGVQGPNDENIVMIGQFATTGELEFNLNMVVEDAQGDSTRLVSTLATGDQEFNNFLFYPGICGCTDPEFNEYDPAFTCSEPDSCLTLIVFGCLNPDACNYNPDATFDIPELCCFVDSCQGLDIDILCPSLSLTEYSDNDITLYPNPASTSIFLSNLPENFETELLIDIYSTQGKLIKSLTRNRLNENTFEVETYGLKNGLYILILSNRNGKSISKKFQILN